MNPKARLLIAGTGSGCGKTTVCCGILKALVNQGYKVAAFKSGPDYIDPMFHTEVIGVPSRNLDLFMLGENTVKYLLKENSKEADIAIMEGAMGFYDGIADTSKASAHQLSKVTNTPTILVVGCKGMGRSVAAMVKGYLEFEPNNILGVILNNVSAGTYAYYKQIIENETKIKVVGYFPPMPECNLQSRHLGLVTPDVLEDLQGLIAKLAQQAQESIDFKMLLEIASYGQAFTYKPIDVPKTKQNVRIGVAQDEAFCFYYQDNFKLLEAMGASLVPFSPLHDTVLPKDVDALLLGGGYPEVYAKALSENVLLKSAIKTKLLEGMPCLAECGGFMYLQENIVTAENTIYPMVGFLKGSSKMTKKLGNFGYITLKATKDNLLCKQGETINAHEFHYSTSDFMGDTFTATKPLSNKNWECGITTKSFYAGYPHLHLWANIEWAQNYLEAATNFKNKKLGVS